MTVSIDYRLEGLKPTIKNPEGAERSNTDASKLHNTATIVYALSTNLHAVSRRSCDAAVLYVEHTAVYDAKAAIRWLRKHASELRIDPDRIAAFGCSAGAMTTAFPVELATRRGHPGNPGYPSDIQDAALSGALIELNYVNVQLNEDLLI